MQYTDVEQVLDRSGVAEREVLEDSSVRIAPAVQRDPDVLQFNCACRVVREGVHSLGEGEPLGDLVRRVVVAIGDDNGNPGLAQRAELALEEHCRLEVVPVPIVEIPSDDDERDGFLDRHADKSLERTTGCAPDLFNWCPVVTGESPHRAVQVNVGTVQELHGGSRVSSVRAPS